MASRNYVLGPNSWGVVYQALTPYAEIMAQINAVVTGAGWELYDDVSTVSKTYRALTLDGISYKYVNLLLTEESMAVEGVTRNIGLLYTKVYESWNLVTHAGTNMGYGGDLKNYAQRVDLVNGGYIFVFVHPQWLVTYSRIVDNTGRFIYGSNVGNAWTACLEIFKEQAGETPGEYPRYAWVNGYLFAGGEQTLQDITPSVTYATAEMTGQYRHFSLPRTRSNLTGVAGANRQIMSNVTVPLRYRDGKTQNAHCDGDWNGYYYTSQSDNPLPGNAFPKVISPFSAEARVQVVTPYAYDLDSGVRGAFCGVKLASTSIGAVIDKVDVKVDPSTFKPSVFGEDVTHIVLGISNVLQERVLIPL